MSDMSRYHIGMEHNMTANTLIKLHNKVKDAHVGSAPAKVNHKKTANPYKYGYGDA
jgi:hypothetical protein